MTFDKNTRKNVGKSKIFKLGFDPSTMKTLFAFCLILVTTSITVTESVITDLSGGGYDSVPVHEIPDDTHQLLLQDNPLHNIPDGTFSGMDLYSLELVNLDKTELDDSGLVQSSFEGLESTQKVR